MMKVIERKISNESYYVVENWVNGRMKSSRTVRLTTYKGLYNNNYVYIIYDDHHQIIEPAWNFINFDKGMVGTATKEQMIASIRLLYYFLAIFNLDIKKLTKREAIQFLDFLYGYNIHSSSIELNLITTREQSTANRVIYQSIEYLAAEGFKKSSISLKSISKGSSSCTFNFIANNNVIMSCDYITESQFRQIINLIDEEKSMTDSNKLKYKLIFMLMYGYGLRIGEVLGITLEDIYDDTNKQGRRVGRIILRNRVNEDRHRKAKTCFTPRSKKNYDRYNYSRDYYKTMVNSGFQIVTIAFEVYELIEQYIAKAHVNFASSNTYKKSIADCIDKATDFENHYLFLNDKIGSPLSYDRINYLTRSWMINVGVKANPTLRRENWCHKCRHGFVIRKLYVEQMRPEDVIQLTRHKNVLSLQPYQRMSPDDIAYYCEDFAEYREKNG